MIDDEGSRTCIWTQHDIKRGAFEVHLIVAGEVSQSFAGSIRDDVCLHNQLAVRKFITQVLRTKPEICSNEGRS